MHVLVSNDDGPPSLTSSPYVHSLVCALQDAGHTVSVVLPHTQRSWIGKAHIVGQTLTPTYFRPGTILKDDGESSDRPFNDGKEEWILVDGTPASCVQIGLHHLFNDRGPVDLVVCGPNYGRNTTAVFALSSGTIGGAMEGAMNGFKSIALSYAFDSRDHDPEILATASKLSTRLVEKFASDWPEDVHLYSINVPVRKGVEKAKILYTEMLQNQWTSGSSFEEVAENEENADPRKEEQKIRDRSDSTSEANGDIKRPVFQRTHNRYKWAPNFADVKDAVQKAGYGDGYEVLQGNITVTPLRANFWHLPNYKGEIMLSSNQEAIALRSKVPRETHTTIYAIVDYPDSYVQPLIIRALRSLRELPCEILTSMETLPKDSVPLLQYTRYEDLDFEHAMKYPMTSLVSAYIIRKALIRKHYLSNTISTWMVKHPKSVLKNHFKACEHFELDYAEFLDDALVEAWDLNSSMARNEQQGVEKEKEWWILKPGMSDGGNGIRLFSSFEELQAIFEEWESDCEPESEEEDDDDDEDHEEEEEKGEVEDINGEDEDVGHAEELDNTRSLDHRLLLKEEETGVMTSQLRHFIVQPYINQPLLLQSMDKRKFHIRTYVLAVGALNVYVYREMLALFAAKEYQPPSTSKDINEEDLGAHLTNTCFQNESTRESSIRRFWALRQTEHHLNWQETIFSQICNITGEVFEAAAREQVVHFQAIPNAFEIFGVDFLVDKDLKVWLLELNAYPDFKQTGQELQDAVIGGLFEEVVKIAVAPFFDDSVAAHRSTKNMVLVKTIDLGRR